MFFSSSAVEEGREARREGEPIKANPYPHPSVYASEWDRGWLFEDSALRRATRLGK